MKKILLSISLVNLLCAANLSVATAPNYPPYEFLENGELKGFDVDIIREISKRINTDVEFKYMDFDALIPTLKSGKVDLIGAIMKKTPIREKSVDFTIDFKHSSNYLLVKDDYKNIPTEIKNCKEYDYKDLKFGAELGSVQYEISNKLGTKVNGYANNSVAILALQSKKIDFLCIDKSAAVKFMEKNPDLKIFCEYPDEAGQGFAVNKGNKELLDKINKALQDMLDDGTIKAISEKYGI